MTPLPERTTPNTSQSKRSAWATRLGAGLASPFGILLIMPGIVGTVGGFLTLLGHYALENSNLEVAQDRMTEQARLAAGSVREALGQSDAVLTRFEDLVRQHDPSKPFAPFAHSLLDLMHGRAGVTYVSASFPDGTFQGAYVDEDGVTRFQDSRVAPDGTHVDRYDYVDRDALELQRHDRSAYDPRVRGFYKLATAAERRVWTEPYLFYDSETAGITRASPVYVEHDGERALHAVVTIDFDVNGLSSYLGARQLSGMRTVLYSKDGTVLAYASDPKGSVPIRAHGDRPVRFDDLSDAVLTKFFLQASKTNDRRARTLVIEVDGESYLSAIEPVTQDPALPWSLAYVVPEGLFLRELYAYEDRALYIGGGAVLLSTLLAYWFARHITRVRTEAQLAKAEAREARAAAREARAEARELGSYRLVACLGRGGMGEVWRAQHRLLAREAAIKLIKPSDGSEITTAMRERFRREAEALARLRSRNTIELFDYGVADDGTFFLVMELLDGVDFESLVHKYGPQPPERVVHLMIQICNSLSEAHLAGLVHRDIKPANLFVCRAAEEVDVVKVLDFGLVRPAFERVSMGFDGSPMPLSSRITNAEGMVGTPAYMAPEQVQGTVIDGRADLYALGGVAFWLLTGKLVFAHDNTIEQLLAHVHTPVPPLRERLPEAAPDALVNLIAACLAKDPSDRPRNARTLGRALKQIQFAPEQAWTEDRALEWWTSKRPHPSEHPPEAEPRSLALEMTVTVSRG